MALLARKKILLAKVESTYGTDATPAGATDAVQTSNLQITPLAGPTVSRNLDRATLGNDLQIQVGSFVQLQFEVEIAGAGGAADDVPQYSALLQGCGFSETVNASTSVEFDPVSSSLDSLTMYFHHDGQKHALTGARGTVALSLNPGEIPRFAFTFTGLYNAPSSTADPSVTISAATPLPVNNTNMTTFTLHGQSSTMVQCSLDMACEVVYRNVVGNESVELIDRAPGGQISIEAPAISTKDWFTTAVNSTTGALQIIHGSATGNTVQIDAPNVQIISPNYGESDGISTLQANLSLVPGSGGDDEIKITTT